MTTNRLAARLPALNLGVLRLNELREFFAYHGVWAVGVRLLRKLSVRAKISVVLSIVIAALIPLSWTVVAERTATAQQALRELAATRLDAATYDLRYTLGSRLIGTVPTSGDAAAAEWTQLSKAYEDALAAGLPVQQVWEGGRLAIERGVLPAASRDAIEAARAALREIHAAVVETDELRRVGNASLRLLGTAAMVDAPELQTALWRLHAAAKRVAAASVAPYADAQRHEQTVALAAAFNAVEFRLKEIGGHLRLLEPAASASAPELAGVNDYLALVKSQVLVVEPRVDPSALERAFITAREQVRAQRARLAASLDQAAERQGIEAVQVRTGSSARCSPRSRSRCTCSIPSSS